ncbi:hypothetical protein C2G38_1672372 [Gigaspora rosea]|uniref:Uncharacterized protein n=1 Tax=Gigaspora rosea TaxID=44941 RepID=A0A397VZE8_9GLOM|nr:hypothetical protein C2G38_1672372 [Gigaspora rosea]
MCNSMTKTYTIEDLENSLKIKQDSALKFRVKFNFILGKYKDAIIDLTKLLDIEPNNKFALSYRGEAYHLTGRCRETIIDLTKLLDIEPNNKFALKYRGEAYYLSGRYKDTITDLTKLFGIEPSDVADELLKKKWIEAFNKCNNATTYTLEDLENSLKINQDSALKFRVKFNFIIGRYKDAIIDLTKLLDIEPNNKFALRYRGEAYHLMGRYKDAIIDLTKLFGIEPSDDVDELLKKKWIKAFDMCNNAANTYTLEDLENSLKINQDSVLKFRIKFNFILGRYKDAIIDLTNLLDIEPNNKFALRYRGEAYHLIGRYREAIIDLTKLLDIEPNNKFALKYRAKAYYLIEKYKESFNDVNKLLKIETNDEWALKLLAKIIEKLCSINF